MDEVRYISILRLLRLLIVTGVCLVLFGVESAWSGDPFSFSGNWSYRKNSDEVEDSSQFNHGYSLGYSKDLSQMLSLAGSVRYSETKPSTGDGSSSINPSLSLDLKNDLFAFNLGASENQQGQSGGTTSTNTSWGVTAYSQVEDWPGVRLSFSSSALADDQSPSSQDSQSTSMGGSIDYEIFDVSMLYDFRSSISDDNISQSTSENTDHMAQVKYSRSFFDNLVSMSASQQFQINDTVNDSLTGVGGEYFLPVQITGAASISNNNLTSVSLTSNSNLIDGDRSSPTSVDLSTSTVWQQVSGQVNSVPVNRVRVLLDQSLTAAMQAQLNDWRVYQSNDGINWTQVGLISYVFSVENGRSVVVLDLTASVNNRYVKVASRINLTLLTSVFVTELEMGEIRTSLAPRVTVRTQRSSNQTQFNLSVRPSERWQISYSGRRAASDQDRGVSNVQMTQSISATYLPFTALSLSFVVSDSSDQSDGSSDRTSRSYSMSANYIVMPTMNLSFGYTRSESDDGSGQGTVSDNVNVIVNTIIYPDWTANFSNNWSRTMDNAKGTESNSLNFSLNSNARLTPKFDLNFDATFGETSSTGGTTTASSSDSSASTSTQYGLGVNYRMSDVILMSGTVTRNEESDENAMTGNLSWLVTRKLRASATASMTLGEAESQQLSSSISWLINQHMSLQTGGSYSSTDTGNSLGLNATVNARF